MEQAGGLRPLGLLEIIDRIFRLYRASFWLLCGIAAAVYIPFGVLYGIPEIGPYIGAGFMMLFSPLMMGATVMAVSQRYRGEPITMGQAYGQTFRRLPSLYGTIFIYYTVAGLILSPVIAPLAAVFLPPLLNGTEPSPVAAVLVVLLCAPIGVAMMLILSCWWPFVITAFMVEGKRYFAALSRATFLLRPWFWAQVVLVTLMVYAITYVIQMAVTMPVLIPVMLHDKAAMLRGDMPAGMLLFIGLTSGITGSITVPLSMGVYVLQYYDARVRKEGYDLALLAQELSASVPTQGTAPGPPIGVAPEEGPSGEAPPPDA